MSMVAIQWEFLRDVAKLIEFAEKNGFVMTAGEFWRPVEMQEIYVKTGRSQTMRSQHMMRLAVDFNVFRDCRLCGREDIKPLGKFWESLNAKNRWGGSWRGQVEAMQEKGVQAFVDAPHFERLT